MIPISLDQWLGALRRRWIPAALVFCIVVGITAAVIVYYPRTYRSVAKLLIRVGRESVSVDPTATTTGEMLDLHRTRASEIRTTLDVMSSRQIAELVVDALGTEAIFERPESKDGNSPIRPLQQVKSTLKNAINLDPIDDRERALIKLTSNIEISAPDESNVVNIEYRSDSPELSQRVVDAWIKSFVDEHIRLNRSAGAFEFFQQQEQQLLAELSSVEEDIRRHKTEFGILTIEGQQSLLEQQLLAVRRDLDESKSAMIAAKARVESLQKSLAILSEDAVLSEVAGLEDTAAEGMRQRMFDLEMQEKELDSRYTDNHPKLLAVRQQLTEVGALLAQNDDVRQEVTKGLNPIHSDLTTQLMLETATSASLQERLKELDVQRNRLRDELDHLNSHESVMTELLRKQDTLKQRYQTHSVKREQARLNDALSDQQITSVNIVQDASFERRPISPRKTLCAALGFLAAISGAFAISVLLETRSSAMIRRPVAEPSESSRLSTPVDASVSSPHDFPAEADLHEAATVAPGAPR